MTQQTTEEPEANGFNHRWEAREETEAEDCSVLRRMTDL